VTEHSCSFRGPPGWHFVTFPLLLSLPLTYVPKGSGDPTWLAQGSWVGSRKE